MRAANALMAALFFFSAVLQLNDPDPIRWIALYGAAGVLCALAAIDPARPSWRWRATVALVAAGWALWIATHRSGSAGFFEMFDTWQMKVQPVEESREIYGLALTAGWLLISAWHGARRRR
ncbi:MAG TPA: transmembrane 220 family protein [Vicinamibacterales bacterium]